MKKSWTCTMSQFTRSLAVLVVTALVAALIGTSSAKKPVEASERWSFRFDDREWHLGHQAATRHEAIREYVLVGQTVENWQELVTSYYFAHGVPLRSVFEQVKAGLSRGCPSLSISVLEESEDTLLYEWHHDGCQGYPPQHEIDRLTRSGKGMLKLSFVEKTSQLSPEKRTAWLTILKEASITSADESGPSSSGFRKHYKTGAAAADAGDFKTAITELETAVAIHPGVSSVAWQKLAYAYDSVGRRKDAWVAMRKGVILNPLSSERRQGFYAIWGAMKQGIGLGASSTDVRRDLGDPDVETMDEGHALWTYGLVTLEFQDEKLSAIKE